MRNSTEKQGTKQDRDVRDIPMWTRRYAENRTLPVAVNLMMFLVATIAFGGLSYLAGWAFTNGQHIMGAACVLGLLVMLVSWLWFSVRGAAAFTQRVTERLYRKEGEVSVGPPPEYRGRRASPLAGWLFGLCILGSVVLGMFGLIPIRYMQPVSAVYVVPFLLYIRHAQRGGSPFLLLWPGLYLIHAILLVAGAPIYFGGRWEILNMLLPVAGYGLVAALAGHIYSRIALRRLRALAKSPEADDAARREDV